MSVDAVLMFTTPSVSFLPRVFVTTILKLTSASGAAVVGLAVLVIESTGGTKFTVTVAGSVHGDVAVLAGQLLPATAEAMFALSVIVAPSLASVLILPANV